MLTGTSSWLSSWTGTGGSSCGRGVRGLGAEGLARPCGPAEGPWSESSMAELVLHINREMLHHSAEIALLRDLYLWRYDGATPS